MSPEIARAFTIFLYLLIGLVIVRAVMSWLPVRQGGQLHSFVWRVTEPLMEPVRRFLPSFGGIDFSGIVVIIILHVMIAVVNRAAAQ